MLIMKIILRNFNYADYEAHASFLLYYKVVDLNLPYDNDINELVIWIQISHPKFKGIPLLKVNLKKMKRDSHPCSKFINFLVDNQRIFKKQSKVKTFPWKWFMKATQKKELAINNFRGWHRKQSYKGRGFSCRVMENFYSNMLKTRPAIKPTPDFR